MSSRCGYCSLRKPQPHWGLAGIWGTYVRGCGGGGGPGCCWRPSNAHACDLGRTARCVLESPRGWWQKALAAGEAPGEARGAAWHLWAPLRHQGTQSSRTQRSSLQGVSLGGDKKKVAAGWIFWSVDSGFCHVAHCSPWRAEEPRLHLGNWLRAPWPG